MGEDKFEEDKFMKALVNLKDTQESIQGFSSWCIKNRKSAYKMARCWTKVIKKVRIEQKLVLFYLVNDVVQHASKKSFTELVDKFRGAIKEALPHLKEEKIAPKVQRCLDIWGQRDVFDEEFIKELTGLIDMTPLKEDAEIIENFQANELCKQVKIMKALEDDADYKLRTLKENDLENKDIEDIKAKLKDKSCGDEYVSQFEDGTRRMEAYIKAMDREVTKRKHVIELLSQGKKYYDSLYGEAEIVATAYTNFGNRVSKVHAKLSLQLPEMIESVAAQAAATGSPVPSPDYDAPSPQAEDEMELKLPGEDEPGTPDYPPPVSYTPPPPSDLSARLSAMDPTAFPPQLNVSNNGHHRNAPAWENKPNNQESRPQESRPLYRRSRESEEREETKRSITQEAMTIPKESMSDFLTKIAHGELRTFGQDKNGIEAKRRRVSDSFGDGFRPPGAVPDLFSRPPPPNNDWNNPSQPNSFLTTQKVDIPPPSSIPGLSDGVGAAVSPQPWDEPVPEWLQEEEKEEDDDVDGEEIVETNLVLDRLRRAATKHQGGGSNLISLTGSPIVIPESGTKVQQAVDMDLSEGEDGEIMEDNQDNDNLSWNQDNHNSWRRQDKEGWSQESHTPPPPTMPQFPPHSGDHISGTPPPSRFNAADLNIPPPPFSIPPPEADNIGGPWSDTFNQPPPSIHSGPPPQFNPPSTTPNSFREPPPGPGGPFGDHDLDARFIKVQSEMNQFSAVSSSIRGGTFDGPPPPRGGGRGGFEPQNGVSDFMRSGSDFMNPIGCNDENIETGGAGGRLSQSFDELRPGFSSPRGGGFRGRGAPDRGRGGFDRSFSSPEKGIWGDRGRGSPHNMTPRGRGDFNRGGRGGFTPRGGFDAGNEENGMRGGMRGGIDRGGMRGMDRGRMDRGGMRGMDRGGMDRGGMRGMDRGGMRGMDRGGMRGMDRGGMRGMDRGGMRGMDRGGMRGMDRGGMRGDRAGGIQHPWHRGRGAAW